MFKKIIISIIFYSLGVAAFAQYSPKWHVTFGGSGDQIAESLIEVSDGNFLLVGSSSSPDFAKSSTNLLLTKFDPEGNKLWETVIAKSKYQFGNSVIEMQNGDFIVTGSSNYLSSGSHDLLIMRINSEGEKLWDNKFGGAGYDLGNCIIKTSDNGFIVTGATESKGNGNRDIWVLKFDSWGELLWDKTFGGSRFEEANSIIEAKNGDFIIVGYTNSTGNGRKDINLLRLNKYGSEIWNRTFGGKFNDTGYQLIETEDSDIILAGNSTTTGEQKMVEAIIIKTNANGDFIWENRIGKQKRSKAFSIVEMSNKELAIAGFTNSRPTGYDVQITILNKDGKSMWEQTYGGIRWEEANSIIRTENNNLLLTGYTRSYISNDADIWTLMLQPDITPDDIEFANIIPEEQIFCDIDSNIPETRINGRNTLAVIIGVEEYRYAPAAAYAAHDASVFYKYMKTVFGLPDRNILFMTNEAATSAEFSKAFMKKGWLDKRTNKNTDIIIYYAGHAYPNMNPEMKEAYLIPHDVDANYADILGIGLNQLVEDLGKLESRSTTFFIDACFSSLVAFHAKRPILDTKIAYNANVSLLFASDKNETAMPHHDKHHGLFTYYLLKGLSGEAKGNDNKITINELYNYVRKNVSSEAGFLDGKQTPQMIAIDKNRVILDFIKY